MAKEKATVRPSLFELLLLGLRLGLGLRLLLLLPLLGGLFGSEGGRRSLLPAVPALQNSENHIVIFNHGGQKTM